MAFDLEAIRRTAGSPGRSGLLSSRQAPVVLLERRPSRRRRRSAPGQHTLGFMLPYTPLHLLLLEPAEGFPKCW
jgi:hydrogenase maturation protein HypF